MNVQTNVKTKNKMDTQKAKTNDMKVPTTKKHAKKFKGSNMVRDWLKNIKKNKKKS